MIANVLLHVSGENADAKAGPGSYAIGLALAFEAHLTALVFELDVHSTGADDLLITKAGREAVDVRNRSAARRARELERAAGASGVSTSVVTDAIYAYGVPGIVADYAKLNEVTVAGTDTTGLLSERAIAEHVLFESGRPIICVPKDYARGFRCDRIVVAWDFSRAAARALLDAYPLLRRAAQVTILTVTDDKSFDNHLSGDRIATMLHRSGIKAESIQASRGASGIGAALLGAARARDADLLVMGGFGHARWREFILGGATRHILLSAEIPVLLSH